MGSRIAEHASFPLPHSSGAALIIDSEREETLPPLPLEFVELLLLEEDDAVPAFKVIGASTLFSCDTDDDEICAAALFNEDDEGSMSMPGLSRASASCLCTSIESFRSVIGQDMLGPDVFNCRDSLGPLFVASSECPIC